MYKSDVNPVIVCKRIIILSYVWAATSMFEDLQGNPPAPQPANDQNEVLAERQLDYISGCMSLTSVSLHKVRAFVVYQKIVQVVYSRP